MVISFLFIGGGMDKTKKNKTKTVYNVNSRTDKQTPIKQKKISENCWLLLGMVFYDIYK